MTKKISHSFFPAGAAAWLIFSMILIFGCAGMTANAASGSVQGISISGAQVIFGGLSDNDVIIEYTDDSIDIDFGKLTQPGDYISVAVTVSNENDFDVQLKDKYATEIADGLYLKVTTNDSVTEIPAASSVTYTVNLCWDEDYEETSLSAVFGFTLVLHYEESELSLEAEETQSAEESSDASDGTDTSGSSSDTSTVDGSRTGDAARPLLMLILSAGSVIALAAAGRYARKRYI